MTESARTLPHPAGVEQHATPAILRLRDERTGAEYDVDIVSNAIRASELTQIRTADEEAGGLVSYDPAFMNTASCRSSITYIDGERGILRYRGYPIEELAGRVPYLDVAWLLTFGDLPDVDASRSWAAEVAAHYELPSWVAELVGTFPQDAHPMAVLMSAWSALGAYRPGVKLVDDPAARRAELPRFLASISALAGLVVRHRTGRPAAQITTSGPDYGASLLRGILPDHELEPTLVEALDILLILQADHEQNCSTNAVRAVGSSRVDSYSATAAGIAALYGPLHGGANEAVIRMLRDVGDVSRVPAYVEGVKRGERRLMGFGHRVYKSYDPRAKIIKRTTERVFSVTRTTPLLDVAVAMEQVALSDSYFIERRLYPNVDFYSGLIYEAMGLPVDTYTVMFAVARMAGWVAQWLEMIQDPEQKIARPRQLYTGPGLRHVPAPSRRLGTSQADSETTDSIVG